MEGDSHTSLKNHLEQPNDPRSARVFAAQFKEEEPEYVAYANGRIGNRPQLSVILRKADGSAKGLTYTYLVSVSSDDPSSGFQMRFTSDVVTLKGRHLAQLFRLICEHKVAEIVEAGRCTGLVSGREAAVVEGIEWVDTIHAK